MLDAEYVFIKETQRLCRQIIPYLCLDLLWLSAPPLKGRVDPLYKDNIRAAKEPFVGSFSVAGGLLR